MREKQLAQEAKKLDAKVGGTKSGPWRGAKPRGLGRSPGPQSQSPAGQGEGLWEWLPAVYEQSILRLPRCLP